MDNEDKLSVFSIPENVGFYSLKHHKGLNSARMQDALHNLPKKAKIKILLYQQLKMYLMIYKEKE